VWETLISSFFSDQTLFRKGEASKAILTINKLSPAVRVDAAIISFFTETCISESGEAVAVSDYEMADKLTKMYKYRVFDKPEDTQWTWRPHDKNYWD